jgi:hypothetical protein
MHLWAAAPASLLTPHSVSLRQIWKLPPGPPPQDAAQLVGP